MATKKTENYTGTRITFHSTQPFDSILSKLYASIGGVDAIPAWSSTAQSITEYSASSKSKFVTEITKLVGPHGFMIFQEFNHGAWVPLFGVGDGLKSKRIILGNPLIAITMLEHDLTAGLSVPVELLVLETAGGGADLVYHLPSSLIAGLNRDEGLVSAVAELDRKLEGLMKDVAS